MLFILFSDNFPFYVVSTGPCSFQFVFKHWHFVDTDVFQFPYTVFIFSFYLKASHPSTVIQQTGMLTFKRINLCYKTAWCKSSGHLP